MTFIAMHFDICLLVLSLFNLSPTTELTTVLHPDGSHRRQRNKQREPRRCHCIVDKRTNLKKHQSFNVSRGQPKKRYESNNTGRIIKWGRLWKLEQPSVCAFREWCVFTNELMWPWPCKNTFNCSYTAVIAWCTKEHRPVNVSLKKKKKKEEEEKKREKKLGWFPRGRMNFSSSRSSQNNVSTVFSFSCYTFLGC